MRPLIVIALALVAVLLQPAPANPAGAAKQVEVTNFPDPQTVAGSVAVTNLPAVQDVNVTNPLIVAGVVPVRFQVVGFSSATFDFTGMLGMSALCRASFPHSRVCLDVEIADTTSWPEGLAGIAWHAGEHLTFGNCGSFHLRQGSGSRGNIVVIDSQFPQEPGLGDHESGFGSDLCEFGNYPVACCAPLP